MSIRLLRFCLVLLIIDRALGQSDESSGVEPSKQIELNYAKYNTIEGKVFFPYELPFSSNWITETRVVVNYGDYYGFIK